MKYKSTEARYFTCVVLASVEMETVVESCGVEGGGVVEELDQGVVEGRGGSTGDGQAGWLVSSPLASTAAGPALTAPSSREGEARGAEVGGDCARDEGPGEVGDLDESVRGRDRGAAL